MSARDEYPPGWDTYEPMCEEIDRLRDEVVAVNAALDQYNDGMFKMRRPGRNAAKCVEAVAKAVGR